MEPVKSGVPKPIYTNGGLRPAKSDNSNALGIKLDRKPNLVSKNNSCYGQEMATDANGDSADTSTFVKTVVGEKPNLDFERKVRIQSGGKVTGKVEDGKGYDPGLNDNWGRLQLTLPNCIEINGKAATPPWSDLEH